jgi:hypothetical protein
MAREITKELQEAIDRFNRALLKEQDGKKLTCSPLVFANTVKQNKNGKR